MLEPCGTSAKSKERERGGEGVLYFCFLFFVCLFVFFYVVILFFVFCLFVCFCFFFFFQAGDAYCCHRLG